VPRANVCGLTAIRQPQTIIHLNCLRNQRAFHNQGRCTSVVRVGAMLERVARRRQA